MAASQVILVQASLGAFGLWGVTCVEVDMLSGGVW